MKYKRRLGKWLSAHILVLGILVFLAVGLPLQSCFESYNPVIPSSKTPKDTNAKSAIQLSSPLSKNSQDAYLSLENELSIPSSSKDLSLDKIREEQIAPINQNEVPSFTTLPSYLSTPMVGSSVDNRATPVNPPAEKQQSVQVKNSLKQNRNLQITSQTAKDQREAKEQILQEKEAQLLSKAFRTRQGYIVKFYKEAGVWKANVVEEVGNFKGEFDLPAYLGEDENLAQNIERLLNLDRSAQAMTSLIQIVLPNISKGQEGYVYIGGLSGGGRKKGEKQQEPKKQADKVGSKETKEKKKKSTQSKQEALGKRQKSDVENRKRKKESTQEKKELKTKKRRDKLEEESEEEKEEKRKKVSGKGSTEKGKKRKQKSLQKGLKKEAEGEDEYSPAEASKEEGTKKARVTRSDSEKIKFEVNKEQEERLRIVQYLDKNLSERDSIFDQAQKKDKVAQYEWAQYQLGRYYVALEEEKDPDEIGRILKEAIRWYIKAVLNGHQEAPRILRELKDTNSFQRFRNSQSIKKIINNYTIKAGKSSEEAKRVQQALIGLRDSGLYSNPDDQVMGWYEQAVNATIGSAFALKDFEEFKKEAEDRYKKYERTIQDRKIKRNSGTEPTWRGLMRVSDLIVMDLDPSKMPMHIEWGGDPTISPNASGIFGPLFVLPNSQEYEDVVMTIDPSGDGPDETAYCVAKRSGDYYFIIDVGGLAGGYHPKDSKDRIGNSTKVLRALISIARENKVNTVIIENNNDKSFGKLLKKELKKQGEGDLEIISDHQKHNKEKRIIVRLQPLLNEHRLIINKRTLQKDFDSKLTKDLNYKFFYQLMSVVENKKKSKKYFDGGNPQHDDRVDAVADAIHYLKERKDEFDQLKEKWKQLKDKAEQGDIKALIEVARRYKDGVGTAVNYEEARQWYEKAKKQGPAADQEAYAEALFSLAQMYQTSLIKVEEKETEKGKEKESGELQIAIELYQQADERGHAGAAYELGKLYQNGEGVEKNEEEVAKFFKKAAKIGHPGGEYELGRVYEDKKQYKEAHKYYRRAANHNNADAQFSLAQMYRENLVKVEGRESEKEKGKEKKEDENFSLKEVVKLYQEAAKQGHAEAAYELGQVYETELGEVKQNYGKARKWYQVSAQGGNAKAQYSLGRIYQNGCGLRRKDEVQASIWYKAAAKQGHREAQFELGRMYENTKDYAEARKWYEMAADQNHVGAQFNLAGMYRDGKGGDKNEDTAVRLYKAAAKQEYADANIQLGWMYDHGKGVEKDPSKALEYYRKEAELKNKEEKDQVKEGS
ncbi:hypothetical protein Aasi_0921 [Candidatus Amoebophilus asiaticus 5a2]|uniref:Terminase large subunit ribonuclease H-like domain-containing protein n=1 Tax=Amoebophilus asiaticus (strain 5a2) TaxID=452471 RepID=B3EST5_AMOA5|nr:tetratricopeptide repeat protein [Candidatus Amoebophilus asiaticus]ACE06287.1 hypothetical protein Aasi_0921 [Candidatus Amoebophilus asiaticus 5a2]